MSDLFATLPRQIDSVADQALADAKSCACHLAQQRLDVVDGDETGPGCFDDQADSTDDGNAARMGNPATLMFVHDEPRTDLAGEHDRLGFAGIQPGDSAEAGDGGDVARSLYREPGCLGEIECAGATSGDLGVDGWWDQDPWMKRREQVQPAHARQDDEGAGVRDDQLVDRSRLGIATSTCWRSSSSDRSKYGTSWSKSRSRKSLLLIPSCSAAQPLDSSPWRNSSTYASSARRLAASSGVVARSLTTLSGSSTASVHLFDRADADELLMVRVYTSHGAAPGSISARGLSSLDRPLTPRLRRAPGCQPSEHSLDDAFVQVHAISLQPSQQRLDLGGGNQPVDAGLDDDGGRANVPDATLVRDTSSLPIVDDEECAALLGKRQRLGLSSMQASHDLLYQGRVSWRDDAQPGCLRQLGGAGTAFGDLAKDFGRDHHRTEHLMEDLVLADSGQRDQRSGVGDDLDSRVFRSASVARSCSRLSSVTTACGTPWRTSRPSHSALLRPRSSAAFPPDSSPWRNSSIYASSARRLAASREVGASSVTTLSGSSTASVHLFDCDDAGGLLIARVYTLDQFYHASV